MNFSSPLPDDVLFVTTVRFPISVDPYLAVIDISDPEPVVVKSDIYIVPSTALFVDRVFAGNVNEYIVVSPDPLLVA